MSEKSRVAITGIGAVFPGGSAIADFWRNISAARSCVTVPGQQRWGISPQQCHARDILPDRLNSIHACLVAETNFDPTAFLLEAAWLKNLDPAYHLLLEAGRQAWLECRHDHVAADRVGVIIGNIVLPGERSSAYSDAFFRTRFEEQLFPAKRTSFAYEWMDRYIAGMPATLLAQALGIAGGAWTLDAACASSLYAIKYARDELLAGRADIMLAGGLSRPDNLYTQMGFSQLQAISPSGRCSPFDYKADGLVVGEGCGMLVLKRLEDALADRDPIYALIAGIGLGNDIAGNLMQPDADGQLRVMHSAYQQAHWQPNDVQHIECHGTGTPVGDAVEFQALSSLWQHYEGECVIGSVKSNIGHLLTAAGAAAVIKTLLAMREHSYPPTANFDHAAETIDLDNSPFRVLRTKEHWPSSPQKPRRAAVSGFGFGGINAHILLEEYVIGEVVADERPCEEITKAAKPVDTHQGESVAIAGIAMQLGQRQDQIHLEHCLLHQKVTEDEATTRLHCKEAIIPLGKWSLPPVDIAASLPQQLLMLDVATAALKDAGLEDMDEKARLRTGVFVGVGLDMHACSFHFRWLLENVAAEWWQKIVPDEILSEDWLQHLRASVCPPLTANRTLGALGSIVASRIARILKIGGPCFTVSSEENSGMHALALALRALRAGELDQVLVGAVDLNSEMRAAQAVAKYKQLSDTTTTTGCADAAIAFVLQRPQDIRTQQGYALISGYAQGIGGSITQVDAECEQPVLQRACKDAGLSLPQVTVWETAADDSPGSAGAVSCPRTIDQVGNAGAAGGLLAVARMVLALHRRLLPASEQCRARYWLHDQADGLRTAAVGVNAVGGNYAAVVLTEAGTKAAAQVDGIKRNMVVLPPQQQGRRLFLFCSDNQQELSQRLAQLHMDSHWQQGETGAHRLALLVRDAAELHVAREQAQQIIAGDRDHQSALIRYASTPLCADEAGLAFIFPGSGNHFPAMGADLSACFPNVFDEQQQHNRYLRSQYAAGRIWEAGSKVFGVSEMILAQVSLGVALYDMLLSFDIRPQAVMGYSLGESTALFATRAWQQRDEMYQRMQASDLFVNELAGECLAAQNTWQQNSPVDWVCAVINIPANEVQRALAGVSRVYLLIVNTDEESVIGGERSAVQNFVQALDCRTHILSAVPAVHCEIVHSVAAAYRTLHMFPVTPPTDIRLYSCARAQRMTVDSDTVADSILQQALTGFNFPLLIRQAWQDGIRLFVELGPGGSCTRMIHSILAEHDHYAAALCVRKKDNLQNLLHILGDLHCHGVAVKLDEWEKRCRHRDIAAGASGSEDAAVIRVSTELPAVNVSVPQPQTTVKNEKSSERSTAEVSARESAAVVTASIAPNAASSSPHAAATTRERIERNVQQITAAGIQTQQSFLTLNSTLQQTIQLLAQRQSVTTVSVVPPRQNDSSTAAVSFRREQCLEFATGSIAAVLGMEYAEVDQHPTRVRLPAEPLMLVDRILQVSGDGGMLRHQQKVQGQIITEHDVKENGWYLDGGRVPVCIAVEAGQADLFLSAWLGIDFITRGLAVYRLLDAQIEFLDHLPRPGQRIRYEIHIDEFFRQQDTWLFRFRFEGSVAGKLLLRMTQGCAGFFSSQALAAGRGIVAAADKPLPESARTEAADWLAPKPQQANISFSDNQITALRCGDLVACFGEAFADLPLRRAKTLPVEGNMILLHRVCSLEFAGGRYGLGRIVGEMDIHSTDWFLRCHFVDDQVMPGTLMYECCLHTLRVFLLRSGWIGEQDEVVYEPVIGEKSRLKCRGQVTADTRSVQYEITLREYGYRDGVPCALADALMYADHRPVVQMENMSVCLQGMQQHQVAQLWKRSSSAAAVTRTTTALQTPLFDDASILAFASGKPSAAFGDAYRIFDEERVIARLPRPPYKFLHRITEIADCEQWQMVAGGSIQAEYDITAEEWYFAAERQSQMPFAVLLEVVLQPCGWFAAYLGSALYSEEDTSFRNLGGRATQYAVVTPAMATLHTNVSMTKVSSSAGMIIQHYDYALYSGERLIYQGDTYFGFFSKAALANQLGIRTAEHYSPTVEEVARATNFPYPLSPPFPEERLRMVDTVVHYDAQGGEYGLGYIRGTAAVREEAWFFHAHFYQDPVWPGSLGLESLLQLMKVHATESCRIDGKTPTQWYAMAFGQSHEWLYRGQILPTDNEVTVAATISGWDAHTGILRANGLLSVDGRVIYQMKDFSLQLAC